MTFPTQPQLRVPPFRDAWYHDFAPPIHSLDRHGDFAPPLLALGLETGFFTGNVVDDDDCAIVFNYLNGLLTNPCHGYLFIRTTDAGTAPGAAFGFTLQVTGDDRAGDISIANAHDFNISGYPFATNNNDFNVIFGNDINMQPHHDWNLVAVNDVNEVARAVWSGIGQAGNSSLLHGTPGNASVASQLVVGGTNTTHPRETYTHTSITVDTFTSGNTFVINDHNQLPLVTYTG